MPGVLAMTGIGGPLAAYVDAELEGVDRCFAAQLDSVLPAVNRLCRHIERYRGKMLRPTLVLLSGLAADGPQASQPDPGGMGGDGGGGGVAGSPGSSSASTSTIPAAGGSPRARNGAAGNRDASVANRPTTTTATAATAPPLPGLTPNHRVIAAVCEMIHMATLVHDDVLDEADMRRKGATVNYLHGNETAVLLGDYLISNAFHLCSTMGRPEINERIGEVTNTLCAGELLQLHHRENWSLDERTYFEIIDRKTASLIALCCELGARESGGSDAVVDALRSYGRTMGIAFQIQDDLLDLLGDESVVGKSLGKDLEKGKLTLPIILALSSADPVHRERLLELIVEPPSDARAAAVRESLVASGAVTETKRVAHGLVMEAKARLDDVVPPSPARAALEVMADAVVARAF